MMVFELENTCHTLFICNDPENYIIIVWKNIVLDRSSKYHKETIISLF